MRVADTTRLQADALRYATGGKHIAGTLRLANSWSLDHTRDTHSSERRADAALRVLGHERIADANQDDEIADTDCWNLADVSPTFPTVGAWRERV